MAHVETATPMIDPAIFDVLAHERAMALSTREWKFRIAGYGYGIREENGTRMVTRLASGTPLGCIPAGFRA